MVEIIKKVKDFILFREYKREPELSLGISYVIDIGAGLEIEKDITLIYAGMPNIGTFSIHITDLYNDITLFYPKAQQHIKLDFYTFHIVNVGTTSITLIPVKYESNI